MSRTYSILKSIMAKRIAWMFFWAATIPTLFISFWAYTAVNEVADDFNQKDLSQMSQNYGLNVRKNLTFAKQNLQKITQLIGNTPQQSGLTNIYLASSFHSIARVYDTDQLQTIFGQQRYDKHALIKAIHQEKSSLLVIPNTAKNRYPSIFIVLPLSTVGSPKQYIVGEISHDFLWGNRSDYPQSIGLCVLGNTHDDILAIKKIVFCSNGALRLPEAIEQRMANDYLFAQWHLDLHSDFQHDDWQIVSYRHQLSTAKKSLFNHKALITLAVFSVLLVMLIGLLHINQTLKALENLSNSMRNILNGRFSKIDINQSSELAEITASFNEMSASMEQQFNSLQKLSAIDREMAYKLDVTKIIDKIILRIETLCPESSVAVFRIHENNNEETQLSVHTSRHMDLPNNHIILPTSEIHLISKHTAGYFCKKETANHWKLKDLFVAEESFFWIYPIFWQSEMYAFISIGQYAAFARSDYKWKEIYELAGRVGIAISTQSREDKLLTQAQYDSLTGLPNRILLQDRLKTAIEKSNATGHTFWLAFLDLDRFKFINDSIGHNAGDIVLKAIATRLQAVVRETDTIARFGGDEFIMILQDAPTDHARMEILKAIINASATPLMIEGNEIFISASIGIAIYPDDGKTNEQIIKNADVAMYRAKEMGKNNFQFFTRFMNKRVTDRLLMETHLRRALELNELTLDYQAKVNIKTNQIVGMEALIRWESKALGLVSPLHFIPLAEETGLIIPIGEWVLRTACEQTKHWHNIGFSHLLVSVNLSARQFKQKNLLTSIKDTLNATGLPARSLELELTESLVMNDVGNSMNILNGIRTIGVQLSVDDFGTGYSSLSYLKNLPLDTLKIDKSFIDDIVHRADNVPIADSIILLAKNLNLKVVAEGVETIEQVKYLEAHGCDEIQGFYYSNPVSHTDFETCLKTQIQQSNASD